MSLPAEVACLLARDRFWKDEQQRLIGTHPEWPDAAYLLELGDELAHALVLVLSRLPPAQRRNFADVFYAERKGRRADSLPDDPRIRLALAAEVVLKVVDVLDNDTLDARTRDFLRGAAQQDDLTTAPASAVAALQRAIGRIRLNVEFEDASDPHGATALAVAEVLDPASDVVDFKEVLARSAWTAVETRQSSAVLGFLLDVERLIADAHYGYQPQARR